MKGSIHGLGGLNGQPWRHGKCQER